MKIFLFVAVLVAVVYTAPLTNDQDSNAIQKSRLNDHLKAVRRSKRDDDDDDDEGLGWDFCTQNLADSIKRNDGTVPKELRRTLECVRTKIVEMAALIHDVPPLNKDTATPDDVSDYATVVTETANRILTLARLMKALKTLETPPPGKRDHLPSTRLRIPERRMAREYIDDKDADRVMGGHEMNRRDYIDDKIAAYLNNPDFIDDLEADMIIRGY